MLGTTEDVQDFRNLCDSDFSMFGPLATVLDAESLTVDVRLHKTGVVMLGLGDGWISQLAAPAPQ